MMNGNRHIIQKTVLDLEYHGAVDALALQKMIARWSGTGLVAALEETLDQTVPKDRVVKIDTLELEINVQGTGNWLEQLQQQLSVRLNGRLAAAGYESRGEGEEDVRQSPEQNFVAAFIFFLEQGAWPWWSSIKGQQEFFEGLRTVLQPEMPGSMKRSIRETLRRPPAKQRVLWQLPEPLFYRLLRVLRPEITRWLLPAQEAIEKTAAHLPAPAEKAWRTIWKSFLLEELQETESRTVQEVMKRFVLSMMKEKNGELLHTMHPISAAPVLQHAMEQVNSQKRITETDPGDKEKKSMAADPMQEPGTGKEKLIQKALTDGPVASGDAIYITNAGLVILAGFLPLLFKKLGLTDEQSGLTDKSRAAMLVQFLASGRDEIAEFELGLAKVLCGIEGSEPVDTTRQLTKKETTEANELLLSAIEYWNVLKDTSVEGLRESFLLREGKLAFRDHEWHLQVEQRPYDMLLQNLPWNISMIRLPWMPYLLRTEWVF